MTTPSAIRCNMAFKEARSYPAVSVAGLRLLSGFLIPWDYNRSVLPMTSWFRFTLVLQACLAIVSASTRVQAATVPAGAVVRLNGTFDVEAFTRLIASRYDVQLRRVVTADIDRDGDLDVVAYTDLGFLVWVNDGAGRLTKQSPKHMPAVDGGAPADTWRDSVSRTGETIQNGAPSSRLPTERAHAPPAPSIRNAVPARAARLATSSRGASVPRAPPA